jgi:membrane-bound lytic murein transglycosylase D
MLRAAFLSMILKPFDVRANAKHAKARYLAAGVLMLAVGTLPLLGQTSLTNQQLAARREQQTQQLLENNQHAQQVQALIGKAEASYNSGVMNYNANRLDAARQDFDYAVDSMLTSGMDIQNDPVLSDEMDRLLSSINALELEALKQGNGFSPKLEEAPVDAANEVTFAPNPELVKKVTEQLQTTKSDFPLVVNDYVAGWINAYTNNRPLHAHLVSSLNRAGKYKEMILKILRDNGVPQDLIYQAITESGFQPQALNRSSGAGGMWQFMPFAGSYGLVRNGYFDERFDPVKSTIAYAKYMKSLYAQFGDWYLAMAAYDWGPGRVQHAVAKTGYADYWELYRHSDLPAETKAYIPSVIAAIIMAKNPAQYGLTDLHPDAPIVFDTVNVDYAIDLRLVAEVTDSTVPEVVALNPALLRLATPRDISYDLHLPAGTQDVYIERLKDIPEDKRTSWRFHVVHTGDTLETIAAAFHAKPADVATYNGVTAANPLSVDDELVIPVSAPAQMAAQQRYATRRGDTLVTVADRFGVSVEDLRTWNHLSSGALRPGHSLYVAEPVRLAPSVSASHGRRSRAHHGGSSRGSSSHSSSRGGSRGGARGHAGSSRSSHRDATRPAANMTAKKKSTKKKR